MNDSLYEPGQLYFFGGWSGYDPPVNPRFPIDYSTAEGKPAFSVFTFDGRGRPLSFEKWLVSRSAADASVLPRGLVPGTHYFAASPAGRPLVNDALSLEETMPPLSVYYRASVAAGGTTRFERVERERTIHHLYSYWDDGRLREFRSEPAGEPGSIVGYDRSGREIK